ncbi:MAG: ATPase [Spirochaetes bacterium]|nr:ATPase [Spirochaetota bacterium]
MEKAEADTSKEVIKNDSAVVDYTKMSKYLAAALCVAGATISSGLAVGKIGSAAMGAVSEKPEAGGTAMILAALAEGVCLWGIAGAFLILFL